MIDTIQTFKSNKMSINNGKIRSIYGNSSYKWQSEEIKLNWKTKLNEETNHMNI